MLESPKDVANRARQTGHIEFFGEFHFLTTDDYATALTKLYNTGCQIGGMASGNGFEITVHGCYEVGHWSFYWNDVTKGVARMTYWTPHIEEIQGVS